MTAKTDSDRSEDAIPRPSHPDKLLFPGAGIRKAQVIAYYRRVAPYLLPFARDRFLTLQRFPDGLDGEGFFQQARPDYFPSCVEGVRAPLVGGGTLEHIVAGNSPALAFLADQAALTLHGWLSRRDQPEHPDRLVIDLDPPGEDFARVCEAALSLREVFDKLGLTAFVMTTGSRGLHVVVPLDRGSSFTVVREFAGGVARKLAERQPDRLSVEQRKDKRGGRLYLDIMRNAYGQTAVLPYSLRAKAGAPVATPLRWRELRRRGLHPRRYHLGNLFRRLGQLGDPWCDLARHAASIDQARRKLDRL